MVGRSDGGGSGAGRALMRWLATVAATVAWVAGLAVSARRASASEILSFPAVADTFADSAAPTTNFNADTRLRADAKAVRISYLRFVVSGTAGRPVMQARLRLQVTNASVGSGGSVHLISDSSWSEATLTFATCPAIDGPALFTLGPVAKGDLVEFVLDGAITGDGTYNLAIDNPSSDGVDYRSNAATGGQRPTLVLTVGGGLTPTVTIVQPVEGAAFLSGQPVTLQANVTDQEDGDLSARARWSSSRDGDLGTGASLVVSTLSEGSHTLTASATDNDGLTASATVNIVVAPAQSTLSFPAMLDTYVEDSSPTKAFGTASVLKVDGSPVRQAFLRFNVTGVASSVRSARLHLTATSASAAASDSGGMLHVIGGGWSEATTFVTRPAITSPAIASQGAIAPNDVVDFDVSSAVSGNGTYDFALDTASTNAAEYRSREASSGRPELVLTLGTAAGTPPVVTIQSPAAGTTAPFGPGVTLSATAIDAQDGDLSAHIAWSSSLDGSLGTGASLTRNLTLGSHVLTAVATDNDLNRGSASTTVTVEAVTTGFEDFAFGSGVDDSPNRATSEKPESKLWFHDGLWWATLYNSSAGAHRIHRLDPTRQTWVDTGVRVDERARSRQDVLWDGQKLYMASRFGGSAPQNRLLRYSYVPASHTWTLDAGFPVNITGGGTEALTLAKDSTGSLWIAYTLNSRVWVNRTQGSDTAWGTPFVVPVSEGTTVNADDIAAVVALSGKIGVFWSNQSNDTDYFAVHGDSMPTSDPAAWRLEVAVRGTNLADDHMNLKLASDGRLFAVVKTSLTASDTTLIGLLVRSASGTWSPLYPVVTTNFEPTRPQCLLNEVDRRVYVFYSTHETSINYKTSSMDTIAFPGGAGTPIMASPTITGINNPTTTKQQVNATTRIVVVGSTPATRRYWHASLTP
jgi:hypothetical protein